MNKTSISTALTDVVGSAYRIQYKFINSFCVWLLSWLRCILLYRILDADLPLEPYEWYLDLRLFAYATHGFFDENAYCEGAGEMFQVISLFSQAEKVEKELKENPAPSKADVEAAKLVAYVLSQVLSVYLAGLKRLLFLPMPRLASLQ